MNKNDDMQSEMRSDIHSEMRSDILKTFMGLGLITLIVLVGAAIGVVVQQFSSEEITASSSIEVTDPDGILLEELNEFRKLSGLTEITDPKDILQGIDFSYMPLIEDITAEEFKEFQKQNGLTDD